VGHGHRLQPSLGHLDFPHDRAKTGVVERHPRLTRLIRRKIYTLHLRQRFDEAGDGAEFQQGIICNHHIIWLRL